MITWREYRFVVGHDLFRYEGRRGLSEFARRYFWAPGFRYTFWMRTAWFLRSRSRLAFPLYVLSRFVLRHLEFKFGISIPYNTPIGPGLYIGHFGGIVVNHEARIGADCNVNHDVTIGVTYGGRNPGAPTIGDRVFLGPGCKVIGHITVGDDAAIGSNAVVTRSVPDSAVAVGVPAEVIATTGSGHYVVHTMHEPAVTG